MPIITKAELAAELRVTKSRVSQYVAAGLPVEPDGKLDRLSALAWISNNQRSGRDHSKGAARARTIGPVPTRMVHLDQRTVRFVLSKIFAADRFYAAHAAVDTGVSLKQAYALSEEMHLGLVDAANDILDRAGLDRSSMPADDGEACLPDWSTLSDRTGEPVDLEAWEAYRHHVRATAPG